MKKTFYNLLFILSLGFMASCSTFGGGSKDSSTGDFFLGAESNTVPVSAPLGGAAYKAIPFTNNVGKTITVTNVSFAHNDCNDFSLFNITRVGNVVAVPESTISVSLAAGESVNVQVRYMPSNCSITGYETTMYVHYTDSKKFYKNSVIFKPSIAGAGDGVPLICTEDPRDFNYTPQTFSGRPPEGTYYLRIDRMVGFIYPEAFPESVSVVSTDDENPEGAFVSPYVKADMASNGDLNLNKITGCSDFSIPGDATLLVFKPILITTAEDSINNIDSEGNLSIEELAVTARGENIPSSESLVATDEGVFQVKINAPLTTGITEEDNNFKSFFNFDNPPDFNLMDKDKNNLFQMFGSPLKDGKITLVGKGELIKDGFIARDGIESILFGGPAYLYIQLEATFTKREGVN